MIEALIVSSLLATILAGALFMHRAFQTKLRVIREARTAAWVRALQGCAKPPQTSALGPTAASLGDDRGAGPDVSEDTFETWVSVPDHSEPRSERVEAGNGFGVYTMTSKSSVTCNPISSDAEGLEALAELLIGTVSKE